MELESLLLSRDPDVLRVMRPACEKLNMMVEVCTGADSASQTLAEKKFDAIVIDCDDLYGGIDVLRELRKGESNKSSVVFAVLNGVTSVRTVFNMGAGFVLQKPITMANALRGLTAAYGFMYRERRRYFRVPVEIPVVICYGDQREVITHAFDLSEGGIGIQSDVPLAKEGVTHVRFTLPETKTGLEIRAQIAWSNVSGSAGIRFIRTAPASRENLDRWLLDKLEKTNLKTYTPRAIAGAQR
ncbi:MAG TPA: PilZ domain-containing protein [Terriglobales bacterium]|nr:PilZ domain-containing protein [Terriglobales bacterium]